jgi:Terminase RNaseH-like domain
MRHTPQIILPKTQKFLHDPALSSASSIDVYNPYGVPEDFAEFARTCMVRSGLDFIPFELFDYQIELSNLIDRCPGVALLKVRQCGQSELVICKMLHQSLLYPAFLGVCFSLGQSEASKLSDRVGVMVNGVKDFSWATDSKTARKSAKGGELLFRPSTPSAARSLASLTWIFADECGFPAEIEEMYGNACPAQAMSGHKARRILGTTIPPEGLSCWYGMTFWNQKNLTFNLEEEIEIVKAGGGNQGPGFSYWIDDQGWARILLHWHAHPIYSLIPNRLAKIKEAEKLTDEQLAREHDLGIPKSGGSLFNFAKLEQSKRDWTPDRTAYDGTVTVWHPPQPRHNYITGTDPNGGGSNMFCTQVWDITTVPFKLVAEYAEAQQEVLHSVEVTDDLIKLYKPVRASVEGNFGGVVIAETLRAANDEVQIDVVTTSNRSKQVNTDRIAYETEAGNYEFAKDWRGAEEAKYFSALKREATQGTDDSIMAWAIAFANIEDILEKIGPSLDWYGLA